MPWAMPTGLLAGRAYGAAPPPEGEPRRLVVRSARAGDAERLAELIRGLSPEARYHRFHVGIPELPASMLDRFVTYDRRVELVLVATTLDAGREIIVAEARHAPVRDDEDTHDFALVVHQDFRRRGLGESMLRRLIGDARARGVDHLAGDVLRDNHRMLALSAKAGFALERHPDDPRLIRVALPLDGRVNAATPPPASSRLGTATEALPWASVHGHHTEVAVP